MRYLIASIILLRTAAAVPTIAQQVRVALCLTLALAPSFSCRSESPSRAPATERYALRTVNERPLPFVDSIAAVDHKGRPLTELRSATLDFIGADSARWTLRYRDLARARTPCATLRASRQQTQTNRPAPDDSGAEGCVELTMDSTVRPMSYERSGEELRLTPGPAPSSMRLLPGIAYNSSWQGDTIRFTTEMYWRDSTGHVSSRPLTLLLVKQ
jgi:hypothetical protein